MDLLIYVEETRNSKIFYLNYKIVFEKYFLTHEIKEKAI